MSELRSLLSWLFHHGDVTTVHLLRLLHTEPLYTAIAAGTVSCSGVHLGLPPVSQVPVLV